MPQDLSEECTKGLYLAHKSYGAAGKRLVTSSWPVSPVKTITGTCG